MQHHTQPCAAAGKSWVAHQPVMRMPPLMVMGRWRRGRGVRRGPLPVQQLIPPTDSSLLCIHCHAPIEQSMHANPTMSDLVRCTCTSQSPCLPHNGGCGEDELGLRKVWLQHGCHVGPSLPAVACNTAPWWCSGGWGGGWGGG